MKIGTRTQKKTINFSFSKKPMMEDTTKNLEQKIRAHASLIVGMGEYEDLMDCTRIGHWKVMDRLMELYTRDRKKEHITYTLFSAFVDAIKLECEEAIKRGEHNVDA